MFHSLLMDDAQSLNSKRFLNDMRRQVQSRQALHDQASAHKNGSARPVLSDSKDASEEGKVKTQRQARHGSVNGGAKTTTQQYFDHSRAERVNTDAVVARALKEQYPHLQLVIVPEFFPPGLKCNLLGFAGAGHATAVPLEEDDNGDNDNQVPQSLRWKVYLPPSRRLDGEKGLLGDSVIFGKYLYKWDGAEFLVYLIDGRDGTQAYPSVKNYYVLGPDAQKAEQLVLAAGSWGADLHDEVWVFDGGFWQKSTELWRSAHKATWDAVILDEGMKKALIDDHESFFDSRDTYAGLKVPWKRGIIYHGPPGNGKTISIKATMHMLWERSPRVPTLYVRSLQSFMGPEAAIQSIFEKAREFAPCYLVLEDIDTIISDDVRSYFLNEVDGLKSNDGIFIVASTNHLDRLDPGIAKRPSRFDRKYYFPDPDVKQREAYCRFWQAKLHDNEDVEFPDALCRAIADITDKFSFAYMQEAFVAALLAIARRSQRDKGRAEGGDNGTDDEDAWIVLDEDVGSGRDDLEDLVLWVEMKRQVAILREGMEDKE